MKRLFTLSVICSIVSVGCTKKEKNDVVYPLSFGPSGAVKPIEVALNDSTGNPTSLPVKKKVVKIKYPKPKKLK